MIKDINKADRIEVVVARQDSFEKRYNRDIVVEEGTLCLTYLDQVPVVIHELVDSAISFIVQEEFDKSIVLL